MSDADLAKISYRLLIVLDTIEIGGPGKGMLQFCDQVPPEVRVTIANFAYPGKRQPQFNIEAKKKNVDLIELKQRNRLDAGPVDLLCQEAEKRGIDIVQSHSFKAHILAFKISARLNVPWLAFAHGWTAENRRVRLYNFLEKRLLRKADKLCVVSERLRAEFLRIGIPGTNVNVLHNAVERLPGGPWKSNASSAAVILCVGRLSHEKGQDLLLQALATLRDQNWQLRVIGDGPERTNLEALADSLNIQSRVRFEGYVSDVASFYANSHLVVVPSRSEGIPNVVLEAFGHGVPVVACNVGGIPEIISNNETGWLCTPDIESLADRVRQALDSRTERLQVARRAWSSLYPRFSPQGRAGKLMAIHTTLLPAGLQRTVNEFREPPA